MLGVKMKKIFKYILIVLIVIILVPVIINFYVILSTKNRIVSGDSELLTDIDYIVILGAGIRRGKPSPMLEDRLKTGISLYNNDISNKILITGDHMNDDYDEVTVMKNYLLEHGIPEEDIITDNYGISTYDSIYRVKNVYKSNKVVIVSQRYHLYRALFLSDNLDLESYGVEANLRYYYGQWYREIREILARNKDFIKGIIKPKAVYTAFNYN
jgi:SanA protein